MARSTEIAVIWTNYGHYHMARVRALSRVCDLRPIELASVETLYGWTVEGKRLLNVETLASGSWETENRFRVAFRLLRFLERSKPQVLLIPGYNHLPALVAATWGRIRSTMNVLMCDTTYRDWPRSVLKEKAKGILVRALFHRAIVGGKRSASYLSSLGFTESHMTQPCDVVDNDFFRNGTKELRARSDAPSHGLPDRFFLFVGRLAPEKNLTGLIRAYQRYRQQGGDWDLVLVGQGPQESELRQQAEHSGCGQSIHFVGFRNGSELLPYYAFAGCFVLPSVREPWGLVVNEAMASGLPVIVSDACGCSDDLVEDGRTGFAFQAEDDSGLAHRLLAMSQMPKEQRQNMGARSLEIISGFSLEAWAASVSRIVASGRNMPPVLENESA